MPGLTIAAQAVAAMIALSLWADRLWRDVPMLPMHWSITGRVTWTAPRRVALAFTPVLAILMLGTTAALLAHASDPAHAGARTMAIMAASFLGVHLLHLWLIGRTVGR